MLDMLLESRSRSHRRAAPRDAAASVLIHATVIVGAVVATAPAAHQLEKAVEEAHVVFVPPAPPPMPPNAVMPSVRVPSASSQRWTFSVPTVVPPAIPLIQPGPVISEETVARVSPLSSAVAISGSPPVSGQVFVDGQVDRPVVPYADNVPPRYPPLLQSAALEGDVVAQFVVDTLGRVELPSIKVVRSSHDLFERAVRDALARARFHPARIGGVGVRQLVEQRFAFSIRAP